MRMFLKFYITLVVLPLVYSDPFQVHQKMDVKELENIPETTRMMQI